MKKQRSASPSQAIPSSAFSSDHLVHDELAVLGQERVGLVIREAPVGLEIRLDQVEPEAVEDRPDHRPGHPVATVDHHPHGLDRGRVDELERRLLELLIQRHVLDRAAAGRLAESGFDLGPDIADPGVAGKRDRPALDQLGTGIALRVVRGGAHESAVEVPRPDEVIEHLGADLAGIEDRCALRHHAGAVRLGHVGGGQAHVAAEAEAQLGGRLVLEVRDHPRERPSDQLGQGGVDVGAEQPADVVGLEDLGVGDGAHWGGCYPGGGL